MRRSTLVLAAMLLVGVLVASSLIPSIQADTGKWRNINPTEYTSVPDARLNSIYVLNGGTGGIGSGKAWAVGNNGTIFNWDGFSWLNQSSGTPCTLNSVNFGGSGIGSSSFPSVPLTPFDSRAGFIVGGNTSLTVCRGQFAMFWNGFGWFSVTNGLDTTTGNLTSVFVTAVSDPGSSNPIVEAWAAGMNATAGTTYHFFGNPASGGSWNKVFVVDGSSTGCEISSLFMDSTIEGWAAGRCGKIWHYSAGGWILGPGVGSGFTYLGVPIDFRSIFMDSTTDGWAVGSNAQIAHFTGGIWTCCVTPGGVSGPPYPTLRSLSMLSSSEAWAVGDGATIVHGTSLTGTPSWSALAPNLVPTLRGLRSVHATGGSNVWAVGETGSILLYDGSIWGSITAPLQTNFNAVWMTGSSDGIAVGNATLTPVPSPTIVHWDGVKWSRPQGTVSSTDLWGTWEADSGDWWVVGGGEGFYPYTAHMSSGTLATVTPPNCQNGVTTCLLLSVSGTSSSNLWAVGTGGITAQWTCPGGTCGWGASSPPGLLNPAQTTWRSVTFVGGDQTKGWVVGFDSAANQPLIDCYVNACTMLGAAPAAGWETAALPAGLLAGTQLNSVQTQLDNSNLVWIAGSNGVIIVINANTQTITKVPTAFQYNLTSIFVDSSSDGWAVGQDTTLGANNPVFVHYDGTGWNPVGTIPAFNNVGKLNGMFLLSSTDGFAVGTTAGPPATASLGMMFHLDPPGGVYATTTITPTQTTSSTSVTSASMSSSVTSTSSSITAVTSASTATTEVSTSVSTSVISTTAVVTETVTTSSSTTTPLVLPAIPGFPWESIIAGIVIGISLLGIARRNKRKTT